MRMDYVFIVFNLIYIIYLILLTLINLGKAKSGIITRYKYYLKSLDNIAINEFELPDHFEKMNKKERKNYVLQKINSYENNITDKQKEVIDYINTLRRENNIDDLEKDDNKTIPQFIFKKPAEVLLIPEKNIFKLSNKRYLLKYPLNEFKNLVMNNNEQILNILLKDNLNHIQIVNQNDNEYIYIFERNSSSEILTLNRKEKKEDMKIEENQNPVRKINEDFLIVLNTSRRHFIE